MAGRIRTIKPEILDDPVTAGLTHEAYRLFIGAIVTADDHGNLRADYDFISSHVFKDERRKITRRRWLEILDELTTVPPESSKALWVLYKRNGQLYAHFTTWNKHQRVDNAAKPLVPIPPGSATVMRRVGSGKKYRFAYDVIEPCEPRPSGDGVLVEESKSAAVDVRSLREQIVTGESHQASPTRAYGDPTTSYESPTTSDGSAPLDLRSPISDPDHRPPTTDQDGARAGGAVESMEKPKEPAPVVRESTYERDVRLVSESLFARPVAEVTDRCGGVPALARLLVTAIPAPRPGVDVGEVARMACVQVLGELTNGKHRGVQGLANHVRVVFVRLYTNPAQLAVARGESKFQADGERGVVDDDFLKSELAAMESWDRGARDGPGRGESGASDLFKRTGTGGGGR